MKNIIKIRVELLSNMFIGGTPMPFEIGGIDQWTAVDEEGFPCIPASSLKGALRAIVMEDRSEEAKKIERWYAELLRKEKEDNWVQIQECYKDNEEALIRIENRYKYAIEHASAGYLFGIREFNNTPKLLCNDLRLNTQYHDLKTCFSIDTKTSIENNKIEIKSNPRTYKTAKKGLVFEGEIELYRFESELPDEDTITLCKRFIISNLEKFNEGVYRLGNSKSRGYGKIKVFLEEDRGSEM